MRIAKKTGVMGAVVALLMACQHQPLSLDDGCDYLAARVVIHWDDHEYATRPGTTGMHIHLFPHSEEHDIVRLNTPVDGGLLHLPAYLPYLPVCYDYDGMETVYYRNYNDSTAFEAYCQPVTGTYNEYSDPPKPHEPTVAEPAPYTCYVARNDEPFAIIPTPDTRTGDDFTLHFYPENVLHEFTFLIYDVTGVHNINYCRGAISGMSTSFFPAIDSLDRAPSTIIFERINLYSNGQKQRWSEAQRTLFPMGWDDPATGWTGDWITGAFCTFGVADIEHLLNRLTIEAITPSNYYYYGAWGYWRRQWEETVRHQLSEALKDQPAWRARNGGFDIVLANDGRLVIPDEDIDGDSGFEIDITEWDVVDVPI
jgi:hypothetical protein